MANHRKHISRWYTTRDMRAINLDWVSDIRLMKVSSEVIGATVYLGAGDRCGEAAILISKEDAASLFDLLE
jgi:hypothetical protein